VFSIALIPLKLSLHNHTATDWGIGVACCNTWLWSLDVEEIGVGGKHIQAFKNKCICRMLRIP